MFWEKTAFLTFSICFALLSMVKTIDKYKRASLSKTYVTKDNENKCQQDEKCNKSKQNEFEMIGPDGKQNKYADEENNNQTESEREHLKFIKMIINYSVTFNSSFFIVGSLAESYFFGVRMVGNILAVTLGYIYATFLVIPLTSSLESDISTPYQYFERRYGNRKYVRAITATAGMIFYFSFLTLYLWGCAILLGTLFPQLPLWTASVIIGFYSVVFATIGGATQSTKINLFQFCLVYFGIFMGILLTIRKYDYRMNLPEMFEFAKINNRTNFFDTSVDLTTRYTILNQVISLSIPWTCVHSLLLPNFIRYRSIKGSVLKKQFAVISNFPTMVLVNLMVLLGGAIFCFIYFYGCNPLHANLIQNKNQTGMYWIFLVFSEHLPAFTGALFASIMYFSIVQHSMGMSLCANTIYCEVINPFISNIYCMSARATAIFKTCMTIGLGFASILYSISFQYARNTALSLFFIFNNSTNSPILGLYFLSAFNPYANHVGAMCAFVINLCINYWWALGHVNIYARTRSQEFPQTIALCNQNRNDLYNLTHVSIELSKNSSLYITGNEHNNFYPQNPVVHFLYTMAPIWYCMFSLLFNLIFGTLFSFIYSIIATRSLDADYSFREERKKYLFIHKMKANYIAYKNRKQASLS